MENSVPAVRLFGTSRKLMVDGLQAVYRSASTTGESSWVSLEAPPGWGKSRLVRELYTRLAEDQKPPQYWPLTIGGGRKTTHPNPFPHVPQSLPRYIWWGISCARDEYTATNALRKDLDQWERHAQNATDALHELLTLRQKATKVVRDTSAALKESSIMELAGIALAHAAGQSTGFGILTNGLKYAYQRKQDRKDRHERLVSDSLIGSDHTSDIVDTTVYQIGEITKNGIPLVVFVEDIHSADDILIETLGRLIENVSHTLIISTAVPDQLDQLTGLIDCFENYRDRIHRINHEESPRHPFPPGANLRSLDSEAMSDILISYYPEIDPDTKSGILKQYTNPWTLELFCRLPVNSQQAPSLELSPSDINDLPPEVEDLHREHWKQTPHSTRLALAVASIILPSSINNIVSEELETWDESLLRDILKTLEIAQVEQDVWTSEFGQRASVSGWIRKVDDYLRSFVELTQQQHVCNEGQRWLKHQIADARNRILAHMAHTVQHAPADASDVHISRTTLNLHAEGHLTDLVAVAKAIEDLLYDLDDAPRELDERKRLLSEFMKFSDEELRNVPAETIYNIRYFGAKALEEAEDYEGALGIFQKLLVEDQADFGDYDRQTLETRHEIATQLGRLNRQGDAIEELKKILAAREKHLGTQDSDTLTTRHDIAFCLSELGHTEESVDEYRKLIPDSIIVEGPESRVTLKRQTLLASGLSTLGRHEEATSLVDELATRYDRLLDEDDGDFLVVSETLIAQSYFANIYGSAGRTDAAVAQLHEVVQRSKGVFGESHPQTLGFRADYADWLAKSSDVEAATREYLSLISDSEKRLGRDHATTLIRRRNFAVKRSEMGFLSEAIHAFGELVLKYEDLFGHDDLETINVHFALARLLFKDNRFLDAASEYARVVSDAARVHGEDEDITLNSLFELGVSQFKAKLYQDAENTLGKLHDHLLRQSVPHGPREELVAGYLAWARERLDQDGKA